MEYKGYEVNYVSNFTDVDDKIIAKAIEEGVPAEEISERYIKECKKDMADMNVKPATTHPLATQEIDGMIDMIQTLIDKGFAYAVNGTVYFRVRISASMENSPTRIWMTCSRIPFYPGIRGGPEGRSPLTLFSGKPKKEGEPYWVSPWSEGRPAGTLSALSCLKNIWARRLISTQVVRTWYSRTTRMKLPSLSAATAKSLQNTGCTMHF